MVAMGHYWIPLIPSLKSARYCGPVSTRNWFQPMVMLIMKWQYGSTLRWWDHFICYNSTLFLPELLPFFYVDQNGGTFRSYGKGTTSCHLTRQYNSGFSRSRRNITFMEMFHSRCNQKVHGPQKQKCWSICTKRIHQIKKCIVSRCIIIVTYERLTLLIYIYTIHSFSAF